MWGDVGKADRGDGRRQRRRQNFDRCAVQRAPSSSTTVPQRLSDGKRVSVKNIVALFRLERSYRSLFFPVQRTPSSSTGLTTFTQTVLKSSKERKDADLRYPKFCCALERRQNFDRYAVQTLPVFSASLTD